MNQHVLQAVQWGVLPSQVLPDPTMDLVGTLLKIFITCSTNQALSLALLRF